MTGPIRRFDPSELRVPGEPDAVDGRAGRRDARRARARVLGVRGRSSARPTASRTGSWRRSRRAGAPARRPAQSGRPWRARRFVPRDHPRLVGRRDDRRPADGGPRPGVRVRPPGRRRGDRVHGHRVRSASGRCWTADRSPAPCVQPLPLGVGAGHASRPRRRRSTDRRPRRRRRLRRRRRPSRPRRREPTETDEAETPRPTKTPRPTETPEGTDDDGGSGSGSGSGSWGLVAARVPGAAADRTIRTITDRDGPVASTLSG